MKSRNHFSTIIRYLVFFLIIIFLITAGLWIISVSEDTIREAIRGALADSSTGIEIEGFKKGLFYSIHADRVSLKSRDKEIVSADDVFVRINPLYLFLIRHKSLFYGKIYNGSLTGMLYISRKMTFADIKLENVEINEIPYLTAIGLKGNGILNGNIVFDGNKVDVKFNVSDAELGPLTLGGIPLPLEAFNEAKGMIEIRGNETDIKSFSLEGKGIYGRIKGKIKDNVADLSLEIMPDASSQEKFPILAFAEKYKVSPGYYVIPIKTNVAF